MAVELSEVEERRHTALTGRWPLGPITHDKRLGVAGLILLGLVALSSLLSVNTFPVVGNDSLSYIDHSRDLLGMGWVELGYHQAGYPFFLAAVREMSQLVGAEPLLAVAVVQRTLLVGAGILAFWLWRWISLPLIILLLAPQTIGLTNFVLAEGVAPPVALLTAISAVIFVRTLRRAGPGRPVLVVAAGAFLAAGVLMLIAMRSTLIGFILLPLVLVAAAWRTRYRRWAVRIVSVVVLVAWGFVAALTIENSIEYGVPSPTVNGEPAAYYYAWTHVFSRDPENRAEPRLSRYFDQGQLRSFIREMDASGLDYREQRSHYEREINSMLVAAGTSPWRARIESTIWALAGGRMDDISSAMRAVLRSTRHDVDQVMVPNRFAERNGLEGFADRYNDSLIPKAVITDPLAKRPPTPSSQALLRLMGPVAVIVLGVGLFHRETRSLAIVGLLVVLISAAGLGFVYAANYRLVLTQLVFGIGIATEAVAGLMAHGKSRTA